MNKEAIKSFKIIKEMYEYFIKKYRDLEPKLMICEKEDFDNVDKALKRLETLEEEKQSFDRQLEKKLKALETLKETLHIKIQIDKEENVAILYVDVVKDFKTKEFTHLILGYVQDKEEYDLLKEVLE